MKKYRKIIIAAAAVVLIVGLVIAAIFLFRKHDYVETNDPDALYPYTVENEKDGIKVTVQGGFPEGAFFRAEALTGVTEVSEKKSTSEKAVFEIKAVSEGSDTVSLYLEKKDIFTERTYVITLYLLADADRKITVTGSSSSSLGSIVSKTEGEGICYVITSPGAGLCDIGLMKRDANELFILETDNSDLFRVLSQDSDEKTQTFRLSAKSIGESKVTFISDVRESALSMKIAVNDSMQFTVENIEESAYDHESEKFEQKKQQAEELVGGIKLPDGVSPESYNVLMPDDQGAFRTADVVFTQGEKTFSFFVSLKATEDEFDTYFARGEQTKSVRIGRLYASECMVEDGYLLIWTSDSSKTCALYSPSKDDAVSLLESLLAADPSLR